MTLLGPWIGRIGHLPVYTSTTASKIILDVQTFSRVTGKHSVGRIFPCLGSKRTDYRTVGRLLVTSQQPLDPGPAALLADAAAAPHSAARVGSQASRI